MNRRQEKFIHVGNFVAKVEVDLVYSENSWSPCLSLADTSNQGRLIFSGGAGSGTWESELFWGSAWFCFGGYRNWFVNGGGF